MPQNLHVIVGLGVSGLSCARYFLQRQIPMAVIDTRLNPPQLAEFRQLCPDAPISLGKLDNELLNQASKIIMSPGVSVQQAPIVELVARGVPVIGDIELFAQEVKTPVIAITGTNAKSTVTTLVGKMAETAGLRVGVGGNLGTPALDLLKITSPELFVLELSSFQLETTYSLAPTVAALLNITPDHMDRYADLAAYTQAKQRVFNHCQIAVCNRDDLLTDCGSQFQKEKINFTLNKPGSTDFGLMTKGEEIYLAHGDQLLLPVKELPILGRHYQANALASLAIGYGFGLSMDAMLQTLKEFTGLPHRCQWILERNGVFWYNDSKGTNVGATIAAIEGLGPEIKGKLILIAGGLGKNADFSPLVLPIEKYVKTAILIGEAAPILADVIGDRVDVQFAKTMQEAVAIADKVATMGDSVLLSPACASFDMFNNFEHRGEVFTQAVRELNL